MSFSNILLLTLHGFTGSAVDFDALFHYQCYLFSADLLNHHQILHVELPGHDGSPIQIIDNQLLAVFEKIEHLLAPFDLNQKELVILGYSMGARIALHYALAYPQKVKKLILLSVSPGIEDVQERSQRFEQDLKLSNHMLDLGLEDFLIEWAQHPLIQSQHIVPKPLKKIIHQRRLHHNIEGLAQSLIAYSPGKLPSLWNRLSEIMCPIYLITGENDLKYCEIAKRIQQLIPSAVMHIVPNVGHAPHIEAPDVFMLLLEDILLNENGSKFR